MDCLDKDKPAKFKYICVVVLFRKAIDSTSNIHLLYLVHNVKLSIEMQYFGLGFLRHVIDKYGNYLYFETSLDNLLRPNPIFNQTMDVKIYSKNKLEGFGSFTKDFKVNIN